MVRKKLMCLYFNKLFEQKLFQKIFYFDFKQQQKIIFHIYDLLPLS